MVITHNMMAMNAQRQFNITGTSKKKSAEKLSSGYRINRAADDAAGLSISEKMRSQIRGLNQGADNTQDGISLLQVADEALAEVHSMLHRMTELSVQAANDTNTSTDRNAIQQEINQIVSEIDRISENTEFNGRTLFSSGISSAAEGSKEESDIYSIILNKNYTAVTKNLKLADGQILDKDSANEILTYMNSFTLVNELTEMTSFGYGGSGSAIYSYFEKLANNTLAFSKYASNSSAYTTDINDGMDIVKNKLLYGNEYDSNDLSQAQNKFNDAETASGTRGNSENGTENDMAMHMAGILSCAASSQRKSGDLYGNLGSAEEHAIRGIKAVLREAGITSGTATNYVNITSVSNSQAKKQTFVNNITGLYDYLFNQSTVEVEEENTPERKETLADGLWIQSGARPGDGMMITIDEINSKILGINSLDLSSYDSANAAMEAISNANDKVSQIRSHIGAEQNRLEFTYDNVISTSENTQAAESRIRDTDMAKEMSQYSLQNILEQAGQSMMSQANQNNQSVLALLQ